MKKYIHCGEKINPCHKPIMDFVKKMNIDYKSLSPEARNNLKRIICGEKVK